MAEGLIMSVLTASRRDLARGLAFAGLAAAPLALGQRAFAQAGSAKPAGGAVDAAVQSAYAQFKELNEGKNADYIPALAKVPSNYFGIAVVTPQGGLATAGDITPTFSIQSISKVFTMALVFQEKGEQFVEDDIGVDATGQVFNSIVAIEQYKGKEMNPLVNPGAIATTGLVKGVSAQEVWAKIIGIHSDFAGRQLGIDEEVYKSEAATNQRNRAISMLMSAYERFPGDPAQAVDLYTRQCSIAVNAKDLGVMAATLANGCKNPVTGKQVIDARHTPGILAVMATAGLYDNSGKWLFDTGLPAKSGVGGGLIAVSPGKFGIGTFAPPLDEAGNSVRGQRAIAAISNALGGNPYAVPPA
jgi:glutaminase